MPATETRMQREFHLKSRPTGMPTEDDFELVESPLPKLNKGEFLVQNEWLSVDPYMRGRMNDSESYVPPFEVGKPMEGGCVGKVIERKAPTSKWATSCWATKAGASTGNQMAKTS